jgi:hypothetical protein
LWGISVVFRSGNDVDWSEYVRTVDFDVAVTVVDKTSGAAKGGLRIASVVDFGGEAAKSYENSIVNKIKFSVPILFPAQVFDDPTDVGSKAKSK